MSLKLTSEMLRAAYNYLDFCPPFDHWNLPDGEEITFLVTRTHDYGGFKSEGPARHIAVSQKRNITTLTVLMTMAHEMIHVYQHTHGLEIKDDKTFGLLADKVCKLHGFDRGIF